MLKLGGVIFILIGAWGICNSMNEKIQIHYVQLVELKELLIQLGNEMRYIRAPIPEALEVLGESVNQPFRSTCMNIAEEMKTYRQANPDVIWHEVLLKDKKKYFLKEDEFSIYLAAGNILQQNNRYMQEEEEKLYVEQLSYKIKEEQKELKEKQKICRYLSAAGAMLLILVLI